VGLQGLDLMTTLIVFSRGGVELNPVVRSLIPWLGQLPAIIASKAVVLSLILLLNRRKSILRFANLLYPAVVAWNVITMLVMK
jgi:hypothetical protein